MTKNLKEHTTPAKLTQAQLEEIYQLTHARVWTICFRILNDEDDARDAFQETYTRLLKESVPLQRLEESTQRTARLAALESHNLKKRRQRQQHREVKMQLPEEQHTPDSSSIDLLTLQEIKQLVQKETSTLSDELRVPLQLHYFNGLTQREIAEALDVSLGTVNTRIHRAFQILTHASSTWACKSLINYSLRCSPYLCC